MNEHEQHAKSHAFILHPLCIFPHSDGTYSILSGFKGRSYIKTVSSADLLAYIVQSHEDALNNIKQTKQEREQKITDAIDMLAELGL